MKVRLMAYAGDAGLIGENINIRKKKRNFFYINLLKPSGNFT
jgi:hypothetical protein